MSSGPQKSANAAEIDRLALALAKEPGSKAFIPLAEEYGKAGMWGEAAAVLEDGLKTYPSFITAMVALGRAYDQMNQPVKATAILEEAVKLSPENLRAHRTLAKIYTAQGAKDAALRSCGVILAVNPRDQEALSLRAMLGASAASAPSAPVEAPTPSRTKRSGKPTPDEAASSGEAVSSRAGQDERVGSSDAERHAAAGFHPSKEDSPAGTTAESPRAHEQKSATVTQLKRWLALIQTRRRGRELPAESRPRTS
jgi:tetratricopeptide (TPR) repeat protein